MNLAPNGNRFRNPLKKWVIIPNIPNIFRGTKWVRENASIGGNGILTNDLFSTFCSLGISGLELQIIAKAYLWGTVIETE